MPSSCKRPYFSRATSARLATSYEVNVPRVPRDFPDFPLRFIRASDREKKRISLILVGNGYRTVVRFINKGERLVCRALPLRLPRNNRLFLRNKGCRIYSVESFIRNKGELAAYAETPPEGEFSWSKRTIPFFFVCRGFSLCQTSRWSRENNE